VGREEYKLTVTSKRLRPAPSSKFENLMGFFSSFFSVKGGGMAAAVVDISARGKGGSGLTKAKGLLLANR
jgi:hypothetical protein